MNPAADNEIQSICDAFRDAWDAEKPASISDFLSGSDTAKTRDVLMALLDLDIQMRSQHSYTVCREIYQGEQWFGPYASEVDAKLSGTEIASDVSLPVPQAVATPKPEPIVSPDTGPQSGTAGEPAGDGDHYVTDYIEGQTPEVESIGNYELIKVIGVGGMGEVYLACHRRFRDRQYAIKLVRRDYASTKAIDRFEREIDAMGHLSHPNLVFAVDAGRWQGQLYLVMQYVAGMDLQQILNEHGPLPVDEACELIRQAALGIAHAHQAGVVHRDIKPSNLMLSGQGELMVLDLGLAGLQAEANHLTAENSAIGTAAFMSPEQWTDSRQAGKPSDVYSLGCTLYSLLTGKPPFNWEGDKSLPALMRNHLNDDAVAASLRRPEIPKPLCNLISQSLQKSPENRVLVGELVSQLGRYCENSPLTDSVGVVHRHLETQIASEHAQSRSPSHPTSRTQGAPAGGVPTGSTRPARLIADQTAVDQEQTELTFISEDYESGMSGGDTPELQWRRRHSGVASPKLLAAVVAPLLIVGTLSLVMAYFGPSTTETWTERFDRLEGKDVPAGTGFLIEWVRLFLFVIATSLVVESRFTHSIREFFNLKKWNASVIGSRVATLALLGFFLASEVKRHLSLSMAPTQMVDWGSRNGITTTAAAEAGPYAWYLPYSLISYTVVLGGLFAFPFIRFWLSDFSYLQRQADRFTAIQQKVRASDLALNNLSRFAHECHQLTKRYVDVLGVLCMGIQYEYWVGQLTLSGAGMTTAVLGWAAAAFALAFVIAISATYVRGYNVTDEIVASTGSLEDGVRMNNLSVGWFLKKTVLAQLGGLLILSLILVGLHAVISR